MTAPGAPGNAILQTLAVHTWATNPSQGLSSNQANLVTVNIQGTAQSPLAPPNGALSGAAPDLSTATVAQNRTLTLSENPKTVVMYLNGKVFDPNTSVFPMPAVLGTVEQWTLVNDSQEIHPFHLHIVHFQVMSINGVAQPYAGEQDIVGVPYESNGVPGQVVIRIAFADYPGKYMFHCHIATHEDSGMMSFVNVVPPGG